MTDKAERIATSEKQTLLRQALEARRTTVSGTTREREDHLSKRDPLPESHYRIEEFPRYRQLLLHREMAERTGLQNPFFLMHEGVGSSTSIIHGREYSNFSSYNYLGLNGHPRVNEAARRAAERFGTSTSSSRIIGGERPPHAALERAIAGLHGTDDAVAFVTGYLANLAIISTLVGPKDAVVLDRLVHNSIAQGAKLSGGTVLTFPHNDWRALDTLLKTSRHRYERVLVIVEGIYSTDGDVCPLEHFVETKLRHKTLLMVDEAHSIGVLGRTGRGIGEHFGLPATAVDVWMGTLSKSFAGCGGYAAGSRALVELLKYTAPGFVFSVGMPPPIAAASTEAIQIMLEEPSRVEALRENGRMFLRLAQDNGLNTGFSDGINIVPVIVGGSVLAGRLAAGLMHAGVQVPPMVFPSVEEGSARLRFFLSSLHNEGQLRAAVESTSQEFAALTQ
jgi:8-amino-7-oxononanoate synthase